MKTAAYYCRVSTNRQEKEETIDSQIAELEEKIKQDGNVLGKNLRFKDDGWSGDLLARPGLDAMRDTAAKKEFEVLYVWDRDRIARKYAYQEIILEELQELGIDVIDLHSSEPKTPEDKILLGFKGLFAEYEKAKIAERMRRGKLYKAKSGKVVHGPAPYGYKYVLKTKEKDGYYKINEYEVNIVRQIFHWVADEGLTIRKVIKRLQKLGIKPRKSERGVWNTSTLCRLLRNEVYIGTTYYNRSYAVLPEKPLKNEKYKKIKKTSRKIRPREDWVKIPVPAILDKDLFYRTRRQLENNAWFSMRNKKHDYFLSGLISCECGCTMCGEGSGGHYYYRCTNRVKHYPLPRDCFGGGVNTKRIDGIVWRKIKKLLTNPDLIRKQAERWLSQKQSRLNNFEETEIEILEKALKALTEEEKRQARVYNAGIMSFEALKELMDDLKMRRATFEHQLREAKTKKLKANKRPGLTIEEICQYAPKATKIVLRGKKERVLRKLIEKIVVDKERTYATIRGHIPLYLDCRKEELRAISRDSRVAE